MENIIELSRQYNYVRSRQLEGTYNNDPSIGCWHVSSYRVRRGWGGPLEEQWPYVGDAALWPPTEPTNIDNLAKAHRLFAYKRVRTIEHCLFLLSKERPIDISVRIDDAWFKAKNGEISMPSSIDELTKSHAIVLVGYNNNKKIFFFRNSWGVRWGDKGYGYLPYEYFDKFLLEAWVPMDTENRDQLPKKGENVIFDWSGFTILNNEIYVTEVKNTFLDESKGWAFGLIYENFLNIEELFVMPKYRRKGHSRTLLEYFLNLSKTLSLPLRIWVSHADMEDDNFQIIQKMAQNDRFTLIDSEVLWASKCLLRTVSGS